MTSKLEKSTKSSKKIILGCLIFVVLILTTNFIINAFKKPPPPFNPYPTSAEKGFGDLPKLDFESVAISENSKPEFKIETSDGTLPTLPTIVNVFKTKTPRQSLTAEDEANEIANSLGFNENAIPITPTETKWVNSTKELIINKLYNTVSITTNYQKDKQALAKHEIFPDSSVYSKTAISYLKAADILPESYKEGESNIVTYLKLNQSYNFEKANSAEDANFVRVDFFRDIETVSVEFPERLSQKEINKWLEYRFFSKLNTDNPSEGLIYIILGGTRGINDIYELSYVNWELEDKTTYYLVTAEDAWNQVKEGKAYLESLLETNANPFQTYSPYDVNSFLLTDVKIIYYSSKSYLPYIQPLYKYSGVATLNNDDKQLEFIFYYPAIKY